jgi:hypothetical protein
VELPKYAKCYKRPDLVADGLDFSGASPGAPVMAGPQFASPYRLESVLYMRSAITPLDVFLGVLYNGVIYIVDTIGASTSKYYVFPNVRVPHPIAIGEKGKVVFSTNLCGAAGLHYVVINWSQV